LTWKFRIMIGSLLSSRFLLGPDLIGSAVLSLDVSYLKATTKDFLHFCIDVFKEHYSVFMISLFLSLFFCLVSFCLSLSLSLSLFVSLSLVRVSLCLPGASFTTACLFGVILFRFWLDLLLFQSLPMCVLLPGYVLARFAHTSSSICTFFLIGAGLCA
jgi:hypothetical protein